MASCVVVLPRVVVVAVGTVMGASDTVVDVHVVDLLAVLSVCVETLVVVRVFVLVVVKLELVSELKVCVEVLVLESVRVVTVVVCSVHRASASSVHGAAVNRPNESQFVHLAQAPSVVFTVVLR